MGILNRFGNTFRNRIIQSASKTPKHIDSVTSSSEGLPKKGILGQVVKSVEHVHKNQELAFEEMEKKIPAPKFELNSDLLSEEEIDRKLKELEKSSSFTTSYMEMLDSVQIAKPIELTEIDYAVRHTETKTYSQKDPKEKKKLPKGKCTADDLVDIITNHRQNPAIWNVNKIAEHLELRPSETEDFLAHFELVDEHSSFILQEINKNQETASYNDPFSVDHELTNK